MSKKYFFYGKIKSLGMVKTQISSCYILLFILVLVSIGMYKNTMVVMIMVNKEQLCML